MNKLIRGARYSSRAALAQRIRHARQRYLPYNPKTLEQRAAESLERDDPGGKRLAKLLAKSEGRDTP